MESLNISMNISLGSEFTQVAMERLMQQMNNQGLFNITESTNNNPYDFTNTRHNKGTVDNESFLNNVVQELHSGIVTESHKIIGQKGMEFDWTITILETQRTIHGFKLGKQI